jgi:hypothetical protein
MRVPQPITCWRGIEGASGVGRACAGQSEAGLAMPMRGRTVRAGRESKLLAAFAVTGYSFVERIASQDHAEIYLYCF